jgi:hypothetical protein
MARLKPTHAQSCAYCHQAFVPVKRGTQRFCSGSCRTTYSRKKKAGTLGRLTQLPTPAAVQPPSSFVQQALAAGTGALAANVVSQTAEYFAVTQGLVQQVDRLTQLVELLLQNHATSTRLTGSGLLALLQKSGVSTDVARRVLGLSAAKTAPLATPAPAATAPARVPARPADEPLTAEQIHAATAHW